MAKNQPVIVDLGQGVSILVGLPTIVSWTSKNRPKKPKMGTLGFNSDTSNLEYWNGSNWMATTMSKA